MATTDNPLTRFAEMAGKPPDEAGFYWSGGPVEVAERTFFASAFSGATAFETDDGVVLVDSGLKTQGPTLSSMLRTKTQAKIHTAIFTHGHVDHAYGLPAFLAPGQPVPRIIANHLMLARFARYARTAGHNAALNARQFGGTVRAAESDESYDTFRPPELSPDTFFEEYLDIRVGGLRFEIHHCPGETDDQCWVFCPERGVLCSGDLFINAAPNAGNPQKVQRYPWDWARGLREMAAKNPRSLCPGHGGPVVNDPEKIQRMLLETATWLEQIVDRTLDALNAGSPPHVDIVRSVKLPESDSPWLRPMYDEGEFIVRNVIRYFGGWWTGRPSELKPAARLELSRELAALAGGPRKLAERAAALAEKGDLRLACHLADHALEGDAADDEVRRIVADIYEQRAGRETSLMAINLFRSAAAYAREGRPFS